MKFEIFIELFSFICGVMFLWYGISAYLELSIVTGNFGLIGIPLGLGIILGNIIRFVLGRKEE